VKNNAKNTTNTIVDIVYFTTSFLLGHLTSFNSSIQSPRNVSFFFLPTLLLSFFKVAISFFTDLISSLEALFDFNSFNSSNFLSIFSSNSFFNLLFVSFSLIRAALTASFFCLLETFFSSLTTVSSVALTF
jgi:hypothetical protein